jgi:hypothetical protein
VDLAGKMAPPGLIDSHVHSTGASMYEFDHPIPGMEPVGGVLAYVRGRAAALGPGEWITLSQVFITRLREQRYPTREELDQAAPRHPVLFRTGPDAALNSLALKLSGIGREPLAEEGGLGKVERDPKTGEPTGIVRGAARLVAARASGRAARRAGPVNRSSPGKPSRASRPFASTPSTTRFSRSRRRRKVRSKRASWRIWW